MDLYKIWAILGFAFLFLEMLNPSMFFLTLSGAAFFTAIAAFKAPDEYWIQGVTFAAFAFLFFFTVRPYMKRKLNNSEKTGIEAKYIGSVAQVLSDIAKPQTDGLGTIKIYGEVWQAKSQTGEEIKAGEMVKIIRNESLIMFVEKVKGE